MTTEIHFVQGGDAAVLIGSGVGLLSCACGNSLIEGFRDAQFLAVGIQCGRCGIVTTTPRLPEGKMPLRGLIAAEPSSEPRTGAMTVPAHVAVVGRTEMARLGQLLRPVTPADTTYHLSPALLDQTAEVFERHAGGSLPPIEVDSSRVFAGLRNHALAWALRHLRGRMLNGSWACMESAPTANAVTHVTGFLHFVATWSHHPLFPAMVATADERGFSLHGLALYAAAHSLAMMGNRIGFQEPNLYPARIGGFELATGSSEVIEVKLEVFDRFEYPFGQTWTQAGLHAAVSDVVAAAQNRINLRNPGLLLLSPGSALAGYDEALIEAIKFAVRAQGRKNRGLMAVAPIVLRLQATPDPHAVRFTYGLFPVANQHYSGDASVQTGIVK